MTTAPYRAGWRKSSFSDQADGCVEVDLTDAGAESRDTKITNSPVIRFTAEQWAKWQDAVRADNITNTNGAVTVTTTSDTWTVRWVATGVELAFNRTEWTAFRLGTQPDEFDRPRALETATP